MAPITRIKRAHDTARWLKVLINNAAKAEAARSAEAWASALHDIRIARGQVDDLRENTDMASDGYTTAKTARRALYMAARELELISTQMGETLKLIHNRPLDQIPNKFYDQLRVCANALLEMRFGPPVPRPRITKEDRARMDAEETSQGEKPYTQPPSDSNGNILNPDERNFLDNL